MDVAPAFGHLVGFPPKLILCLLSSKLKTTLATGDAVSETAFADDAPECNAADVPPETRPVYLRMGIPHAPVDHRTPISPPSGKARRPCLNCPAALLPARKKYGRGEGPPPVWWYLVLSSCG